MSPHKNVKFPPLTSSQKPRLTRVHSRHCDSIQAPEEEQGGGRSEVTSAVSDLPPSSRKLCLAGSSCIYAGTDRKPKLLMHLEDFVRKELQAITLQDSKNQELKLQVYRDTFGCFIKEFKTYQPILSAIKKEYENTLAYQQDQIQELEPLRSHLRLVREECERKIQARWGEEQAEIGDLKREKQQLQWDIEAMREKEKSMQAVIERLQYELSKQYVLYREEHDARKLLIGQLSDLTQTSVKEELPADENADEVKDPVELQLALRVCRDDLTRAQEVLSKMKAEYWDVVPRRDWDSLEQTHKQTLQQREMLQADFNHLKSEYDALLKLHQRGDEMFDSTGIQQHVQSDEPVSPPVPDLMEENTGPNQT